MAVSEEYARAVREIGEKDAEIASLREQLAIARDETKATNLAADAEARTLRAEVERLKEIEADAKIRLDDRLQRLDAANAKLKEAEERLRTLKMMFESERARADSAEQAFREAKYDQSTSSGVHARLAAAEERAEAAERERDRHKNLCDEWMALAFECPSSEVQIVAALERMKQLAVAVGKSEHANRVESLESDLAQAREQLTSVGWVFVAYEEDDPSRTLEDRAQDIVSGLENEAGLALESLAQARERIAVLEEENARLRETIARQGRDIEDYMEGRLTRGETKALDQARAERDRLAGLLQAARRFIVTDYEDDEIGDWTACKWCECGHLHSKGPVVHLERCRVPEIDAALANSQGSKDEGGGSGA